MDDAERTRTVQKMAEEMYSWYGASADWKNFQGNPMPQFHVLPENIQSHWRYVASQQLTFEATHPISTMRWAIEALKVKIEKRELSSSELRRMALAVTKMEEALLWLRSEQVNVG